MITKPQILQHPNIPKPLHGINPRTINGEVWWDKIRQKVYEKYNYHCAACGTHKSEAKKHKWLEAHEFWQIDYMTGICKIETIEPLCHYCHNFIHSGRLKKIIGIDKSNEEVKGILEHGLKILSENNLQCFYFTIEFAKSLNCNTYGVDAYDMECNDDLQWSDFVLVYNNKEYRSKFNSINEWAEHYSVNN